MISATLDHTANFKYNYFSIFTAPCISAVLAVSRCPSVRLSVTLVDCIQTAEDIVKLLSRPGNFVS